ncbi:MAG TPA: YitT family protein [Clostridia bacterium]|nr:YitT family protein [Clostridia bacterium]
MKKSVTEFIFINFGLLLVAAGIYLFLVPNNLAAGGVSGLSMVINHFVPRLPVGLLMLMMNIVLFIAGIIFIGRGFGFRTIYSSLALSGMIMGFEKLLPLEAPLTGDLFLELIFGILISGAGMGIVFLNNASTGGTDIIAKILNRYFNINIGKGVLMADFFITLAAAFAFGIRTGLYALLGVIINGFVIDSVIEGIETNKQVTIITAKMKEINDFIINTLGRGATIYTARGAYTNEQKDIIIVVLDRKEFIRLRNFIKAIDDKAFITVNKVHETLGEGFKSLVQ